MLFSFPRFVLLETSVKNGVSRVGPDNVWLEVSVYG
jgi:hypothetical protein